MSIPKNRACDHEENRKKICATCGRKIILGTKKIYFFQISDKMKDLIKDLTNKNFELDDPKYPTSICTTCRLTFTEYSRNNYSRPLPKMPMYELMILPIKPLSISVNNSDKCDCFVCTRRRSKVRVVPKTGYNSKRNFLDEVNDAGMYEHILIFFIIIIFYCLPLNNVIW